MTEVKHGFLMNDDEEIPEVNTEPEPEPEPKKLKINPITAKLNECVDLPQDVIFSELFVLVYGKQFRCTDTSNNSWMYFSQENHRWIDGLIPIMNLLQGIYRTELVFPHLEKVGSQYKNILANEDSLPSAHEKAKKILKNITKIKASLTSVLFLEKIIKVSKFPLFDKDFMSNLDTNNNLMCFSNGVMDLTTYELRAGKPEDMISLSTGYNFILIEKCDPEITKAIETFVSDVGNSPDISTYFMEIVKYILFGGNPNAQFCIWTGNGSNGKSRLLEVIGLSLGEYHETIDANQYNKKVYTQSPQRGAPEKLVMKGKLMISMEEPDDNGAEFNTGAMKKSTDSKQVARGLFSNIQQTFTIRGLQVYLCNNLPSLHDFTNGTKRRLNVTHFTSTYVDNPNPNIPSEKKKDTKLREKLPLWKDTFMAMAIDYAKKHPDKDISIPPRVIEWTNQYFRDEQDRNDPAGCWVSDRFEVDQGVSVDDDGIEHITKLSNDELFATSYLTIPDLIRLYKSEGSVGQKSKNDLINAFKLQGKYAIFTNRIQKKSKDTGKMMDFRSGVIFNIKVREKKKDD